ncbi:cytochrome c oxidase subunit 3 [Noviherbaspirillum massiliense]|uniref:cytochrome c oxidase subunit 3 n=1 Tax=Noviherbaspirillum massiliense TaxID=1465823 RepID=UPI00031529CF|nr:cytochrome c oxidase subunit 3 [Noviherbaspirillum massiliense]
MNTTVVFKVARDEREEPRAPDAAGWRWRRGTPGGIGLWAFIGVATSLFSLFLAAYVMRMASSDWSPIAMPWQLWISTTLLLAGSVSLQRASAAARHAQWDRARTLLLVGGSCAFAFLCVQLSAWQALQMNQVRATGNPAASFFYLLTAMHGLHVLGGLAGWGWTMYGAAGHAARPRVAARIGLCARYWHFLLAVWLVLFAALGWLTPETVRLICGTG